MSTAELCPTCGQPDNCGDCNHLIEFEVTWLNWDQQPFDATDVLQYDLSDAIAAACRLMLKHPDAHGFFVRRKENT